MVDYVQKIAVDNVHYLQYGPYHAPRMVLRTPTGAPDAPWDTMSNVLVARLRGSSIE